MELEMFKIKCSHHLRISCSSFVNFLVKHLVIG
jgi:hypothetical protein